MTRIICLAGVCVAAVAPLAGQAASTVVSLSGRLGTLQTTGDFGNRVQAGFLLGVGAEIQVHRHVSLLVGIDMGFLAEDGGIVLHDPLPITHGAELSSFGDRPGVTATRFLGGVGFHLTDVSRSRVVVRPSVEFGIQLFDFEHDDTVAAAISGGLTLGYRVSRTVTLLAIVRADASFVDDRTFSVPTEQVLAVPIAMGASVRLD